MRIANSVLVAGYVQRCYDDTVPYNGLVESGEKKLIFYVSAQLCKGSEARAQLPQQKAFPCLPKAILWQSKHFENGPIDAIIVVYVVGVSSSAVRFHHQCT